MRKINKDIQFPVIVHEDESGGYWVECPTFRGCHSQGDSIDEAIKNIREAIALSIEEIEETSQEEVIYDNGNISFHLVTV